MILSWNPGWWKGLRDEDKTENAAIGDRRGMAVVGCNELPETVEEPLEGRKNRQRVYDKSVCLRLINRFQKMILDGSLTP